MKSKSTIRRELRALRAFIDDPNTDPLERRIAYAMETSIRWATEKTVGWEHRVVDVIATADLIRKESAAGAKP